MKNGRSIRMHRNGNNSIDLADVDDLMIEVILDSITNNIISIPIQ